MRAAAATSTRARAAVTRDPVWAVEPTSKHAHTPEHREAGEQNQVMPFRFDDGDDDVEELRRRRFSSGSYASSSSDDTADARSYARRSKPQSRENENEWERASSHAPSSSSHASSTSDVHASESDNDDDEYAQCPQVSKHHNSKACEEPELPRTSHRKPQQQSNESHSDASDDSKATVASTAIVAAHTPATAAAAVAAPTPTVMRLAMSVDLSRISKLAVFPGSETQLLQGHVVRVKTLLHAQYHFYIKDTLVLLANKQPKNRTSNYHIFDMTRAPALSAKLTKKSGHYVGKLRADFSKRKSVLIGNLSSKTELGAVLFDPTTSASEPRHLRVVLPMLSPKRQEIEGLTVGDSATTFSLLLDLLKLDASAPQLQVFANKAPVFDNGFYRLNFHGRVSVPSVKNFQLVRAASAATAAAEPSDVCLQFGKVNDKKFHLDFRAPLTPIQAFAIAIAQCNL